MIGPATRAIMESTSANAEVLAVCEANPMDADLGRGYIKTPLGPLSRIFSEVVPFSAVYEKYGCWPKRSETEQCGSL